MKLIGSAALKHHYPQFNRVPKDQDYAVADQDWAKKHTTKTTEYLYNPVLCEWSTESIASPTELLSLKMSHLFWDINWSKHMWDTQFLLKQKVEPDLQLTKQLYQFWKKHHSNRKLLFDLPKEQFFTNAIRCPVSHDRLHHLLNPKPLYKQILQHPDGVKADPLKMAALTDQQRFDLLLEELQVMGYERFGHWDHHRAMHHMFKLYLVKHAPFDVGIMMITHYLDYLQHPFDFVTHLTQAVEHELLRNRSRQYEAVV